MSMPDSYCYQALLKIFMSMPGFLLHTGFSANNFNGRHTPAFCLATITLIYGVTPTRAVSYTRLRLKFRGQLCDYGLFTFAIACTRRSDAAAPPPLMV